MSHDVADKREAILQAALELFADRGFHGVAVPEVAHRAGVGAGTIYRHFESKEALVNAVFQRWKGILLERLLVDFPYTAPLRDQFHALWRRWADFVVENPKAALFLELHHHAPYLDDQSRAIEERVMSMVTAALEVAKAQKVLRDAPTELLIAIVHGIFVGMVQAFFDERLEPTPELLDMAEECCWEAIRH